MAWAVAPGPRARSMCLPGRPDRNAGPRAAARALRLVCHADSRHDAGVQSGCTPERESGVRVGSMRPVPAARSVGPARCVTGWSSALRITDPRDSKCRPGCHSRAFLATACALPTRGPVSAGPVRSAPSGTTGDRSRSGSGRDSSQSTRTVASVITSAPRPPAAGTTPRGGRPPPASCSVRPRPPCTCGRGSGGGWPRSSKRTSPSHAAVRHASTTSGGGGCAAIASSSRADATSRSATTAGPLGAAAGSMPPAGLATPAAATPRRRARARRRGGSAGAVARSPASPPRCTPAARPRRGARAPARGPRPDRSP